jgi:small subunit ribosomal protein S1
MVLALDPANRRLALGLKQMEQDPTEAYFAKIQVGDVVHGKVTRHVTFGAFVELHDGIEGLCHISEMPQERGKGKMLDVGTERDFRILRINAIDRKIALSTKDPEATPPPPEPVLRKAKEKEPERLSTMAEALSSAGITLNR